MMGRVMNGGERRIFWSVITVGITLAALTITLVRPLRDDLIAHEKMPAHAATSAQMRSMIREMDQTRAAVADLRVDIRDLRTELAQMSRKN